MDVSFDDPKVEENFLEFRIQQVRANWKIWSKIQMAVWGVACGVIWYTRDMSLIENKFEVIGSVLHIAAYQISEAYFYKDKSYTRFMGIFLMWWFVVYMTEATALSGEYKVYEGLLVMISIEYCFTVTVVVDIWLCPIILFVCHTYTALRFWITLDGIPDVLLPALYLPLLYLTFTCYIINSHIKKDFLLREVQKNLIDRFYHILQAFPERIVISKVKLGEEAEYPFTNDPKLESHLHNERCGFIEDIMRM